MPGIFGFFTKKETDKQVNEDLIVRMGRIQVHSEKYALCTFSDTWCGLGFVGLPIPGEEQFVVDCQRNMASAYGGYIYEFQRVAGGAVTRMNSKALGLCDIYRTHPDTLPEKLNGSYNVAVYDLEHRHAIICNDRIGHWQLYYCEDDTYFLFAGEYKAFLQYQGFDRSLDEEAVRDYFNFKMVLGEKTFFRKVKRLRWAQAIRYRNGIVSIEPWWEYRFPEESRQTVDELVDEAHGLYQQNIRKQSAGFEHVIIPLSGGLDSRMVLAHARQAGLRPYTFCHGQARSVEVRLAARVASEAGVTHHNLVEIDPLWTVDLAERFVWLTGGMVNLGPSVLLGVASRYGLDASRSVFLNGLAGRTAFGYGYFNETDISSTMSWPEKMQRLRIVLDGQFTNDNYYRVFQTEYRSALKAVYDAVIEQEFARYGQASSLFCHQRDLFALENRFRKMYDQIDVNRFLVHDHWALEDDRTVEFYLKIPPRLKVGTSRILLVEGLKRMFPHLANIPQQHTGVNLFSQPSHTAMKVTAYKKQMMHYAERLSLGLLNFHDYSTYVHYDQWYRSHRKIREFFETVLLDQRTLQRGYFDHRALESLLKYQRRGGNAFGVLSHLVSFELFNRLYCER
jgi:asparagine synthetase B (glutamine-hydrolysing)